jgi:hypothetical protein
MEKDKLINFVKKLSKNKRFQGVKKSQKIFNILKYELEPMTSKMSPESIIMISFLLPKVNENIDELYDILKYELFIFSTIDVEDDELDETCDYCGGDGDIYCNACDSEGEVDCSDCDGSGNQDCTECDGTGEDEEGMNCDYCNGSGKEDCNTCNGSGRESCDDCGGRGQEQCDDCGGSGTQSVDGFEYYQRYFISYDENLKLNLLKLEQRTEIPDDIMIDMDNVIEFGNEIIRYKGYHNLNHGDEVFMYVNSDKINILTCISKRYVDVCGFEY